MMKFSLPLFFLLLCVAISSTSGQMRAPQVYIEAARPIQLKTISPIIKPEIQPTETIRNKQETAVQPLFRERFRVTLNEPSEGFVKLDNMLSVLDRVAYAISRPAAIINIVKFVALAVSSLIMSAFILPRNNFEFSSKRNRERKHRHGLFGQLTHSDIEGMIELMTKNYDETLNRAGFVDRGLCRERSLCVLGDMMACDFPTFIVTAKRFTRNHLPPIDSNKNKYTKALALGLNQTDCDRAYKTNSYECPSIRDYARSYFLGGHRRRRDHFHWHRQ